MRNDQHAEENGQHDEPNGAHAHEQSEDHPQHLSTDVDGEQHMQADEHAFEEADDQQHDDADHIDYEDDHYEEQQSEDQQEMHLQQLNEAEEQQVIAVENSKQQLHMQLMGCSVQAKHVID